MKILIVVDMQNDFVTGALANPAAQAIVPKIADKISEYKNRKDVVIFTRDSHFDNYLNTFEGKHLPIPHCIHGTHGWLVVSELSHPECRHIDKSNFGYPHWSYMGFDGLYPEVSEIELVGTCTDICVISNALLLKAAYPEIKISVDSSCCAGLTPEKHAAALEVMKSCQINVY
jgi:nicotinamidase-related amidase